MALKSPDMSICTEKQRCLSGANFGLAYDPLDACEAPSVFNELKCDCEIQADSWGVCAIYQNSCTEAISCRCQVLETGPKGVPPTVLPNNTGNPTCGSGGFSIDFAATYNDNSTEQLVITSGFGQYENLLSYEVVYNVATGGYACATGSTWRMSYDFRPIIANINCVGSGGEPCILGDPQAQTPLEVSMLGTVTTYDGQVFAGYKSACGQGSTLSGTVADMTGAVKVYRSGWLDADSVTYDSNTVSTIQWLGFTVYDPQATSYEVGDLFVVQFGPNGSGAIHCPFEQYIIGSVEPI